LNVQGNSFLESDLAAICKFEEKKHVQIKLETPKKYKRLKNREERKIVRFLCKYWQPGSRNRLEMAFLGWCLKKGVNYESAYGIIDQVTKLTDDEERGQRLQLVEYHYKNRRNVGSRLLGIAGLREIVKEAIAKNNCSEARKELMVEAYSSFLLFFGGKWEPPRYRRVEKLPFIPTEREIDDFIAGCSHTKRLATYLQLLKETRMRSGEASKLKWTDIDFINGIVRVTPEKGSSPRILKISNKLMAMLNALPKDSTTIFPNVTIMRKSFARQRARLTKKLQNPRLKQITFHTFRHWKATMEYARTKDILHVMRLLGHKNIKNTLIYTQLIDFKDDEFVCKAATTSQEAKQFIEAGFEYVCTATDGTMLFRKRK